MHIEDRNNHLMEDTSEVNIIFHHSFHKTCPLPLPMPNLVLRLLWRYRYPSFNWFALLDARLRFSQFFFGGSLRLSPLHSVSCFLRFSRRFLCFPFIFPNVFPHFSVVFYGAFSPSSHHAFLIMCHFLPLKYCPLTG
jgi:hypothetical protein